MNKVMLIGNLTKDPELSTTQSGISICKFSIAVNSRTGSESDKVNFFNIVTWRGLADNCSKYLQKGNKIAVSGRIELDNYTDKDGNQKTWISVQADDVEFLTPKGTANETSDYTPKPKSTAKPVSQLTPVEDDGLPF